MIIISHLKNIFLFVKLRTFNLNLIKIISFSFYKQNIIKYINNNIFFK